MSTTRSVWKGPFVDDSLIRKIQELRKRGKNAVMTQVIKTRSRSSHILPEFIDMQIGVYDGRQYVTVRITDGMVSHRLGEFAGTRKFRKVVTKSSQR